MKKKFDLGLYTGRFNSIHLGHQSIIDRMLMECNVVLILVGNCQAQRTKENPLNVLERVSLIKRIYGKNKRVIIGFYPDLPNKPETPDYSTLTKKEAKIWGDWILLFCKYYAGKIPNAIYSGSEAKIELFYPDDLIEKVKVDNSLIKISATELKDFLLQDKKGEWENWVSNKIYEDYELIRKAVLESNNK